MRVSGTPCSLKQKKQKKKKKKQQTLLVVVFSTRGIFDERTRYNRNVFCFRDQQLIADETSSERTDRN